MTHGAIRQSFNKTISRLTVKNQHFPILFLGKKQKMWNKTLTSRLIREIYCQANDFSIPVFFCRTVPSKMLCFLALGIYKISDCMNISWQRPFEWHQFGFIFVNTITDIFGLFKIFHLNLRWSVIICV